MKGTVRDGVFETIIKTDMMVLIDERIPSQAVKELAL